MTAALCIAALALLCAGLWAWLRTPARSELEYTAAFWRRAAMRAAWRGDDATEAYAERQYRACEAAMERRTEERR